MYRGHDSSEQLLFRPYDHFSRLFGTSMRVLRMQSRYTESDLLDAIAELLARTRSRPTLKSVSSSTGRSSEGAERRTARNW